MIRIESSPQTCRRKRLAGVVALLVAAGCATRWAPRDARPELPLQWPQAPNPAKLSFARSITGFAPGKGTGSAWHSFVYGRGPSAANEFVLPVAVATAPDGRIAVADLGRACVHLFVPAEGRYLRLTGDAARPLASPVGLAFDGEERLYVTDSTGALFAFDARGAQLFVRTTVGAPSAAGAANEAGDEPLLRPTGIAFSPARKLLYVVDTLASRIHVYSPDGTWRFSFGRRGTGEGELNFPTHLFRSAAGRLFVADSLNFRIAFFDESGAPLGSFGRHGDGSGDLAMPKGVAVDADGVVYVADSVFDNLQLFHDNGDFLLTLGRRGRDFGEFWLPSGIFIGANGELYVCDTYNHRVQVFEIRERYAPIAS